MEPKWPTSIFESARQTRSRFSNYRTKCTPFQSPLVKPSRTPLNTLGQKQYLAGDIGENFLMNKLLESSE